MDRGAWGWPTFAVPWCVFVADHRGPVHEEALPCLKVEPKRSDLLRFLGYPHAAQTLRHLPELMEQALERGQVCLATAGVYALYDVGGRTDQSLTLGGVVITGRVGEFLRSARQVAVFVVTAGADISKMAQRLAANGDTVTAWALDALGSWAAEAAADALMARLAAHLGTNEVLSLRYSPGYCGMDLDEQAALFRLVRAEDIGVALQPSSRLMMPLKSISGLVGLERPLRDLAGNGPSRSPCVRCGDLGCPVRRR